MILIKKNKLTKNYEAFSFELKEFTFISYKMFYADHYQRKHRIFVLSVLIFHSVWNYNVPLIDFIFISVIKNY